MCSCRDVLGDADVEEAEAVYSMVALTQAKAPDWSRSKQAVAATAEVGKQHMYSIAYCALP